MKLNEFVKRQAGRPVVLRMSRVLRQGYPDLSVSEVQKASIASLINIRGIPYDDMCELALGHMVNFNNLTAEEAVLVIERGNSLYQHRKADRHRRTYGSERPQPTKITAGQRSHIQKLIQQTHVPYRTILHDALGVVMGIDELTYTQAVLVIRAGKRMRGKQSAKTALTFRKQPTLEED